MPKVPKRINDKWYHNIPYIPSKEELDKQYEELLEKAKRKAVRLLDRRIQRDINNDY